MQNKLEEFGINNRSLDSINPKDPDIVGDITLFNTGVDKDVLKHLPKSHQLMLKIDELAQKRLNELLEPVRRGEMTLEDLKRSRELI